MTFFRWVGVAIAAALCGAPFAAAAEAPARSPVPWDFSRPSSGDNPGEEQRPPSGFPIPPAPVLSFAEAMRSFRLQPGFRLELVASEPLVNTPVALDFDPDGRIWVVEMRGYQNDPEGDSRLQPNGRIVVLEDTDNDGKVDKSTVYMEGLVLPRAVRVLSDGVLVAEPPYVWYTRDRDGDGRMDEKIAVVEDYGVRDSNPGHSANGLVRAMDNWLHSPTYSGRLRRIGGKWIKEPVPVLGHWGMGMDDFGRTYMNSNSAPLRVNLLSPHYQIRNPNHDGGGGIYEPMTGNDEREVYPIRPNPGVNRGYMPSILRKDGTLARNTAGCGTSIYRGDRLPAEVRGNHFFCEPAGNLIRRTILTEHADGRITGVNAHPQAEFLASTDERFRPVNTHTAPDGTLYVVDMHRGVLEAHPFVTTFLKRQIHERGLLHPLDRGRIYRVVHESMPPGPPPRLSKAAPGELVGHLAHANGWWRDTAQRLLIERGDTSIVPALRSLARGRSPEIPRLHAWWTLEGLGVLTIDDITAAAADSSRHIRAAALRWAEPALRGQQDERLVGSVVHATEDPEASVRLQAAASLGELPGSDAVNALASLLTRHLAQPYLLDAVIFSLPGREFELLSRCGETAAWTKETPEHARAFSLLAAAIFRSGVTQRAQELLQWTAARAAAWQQLAILRSVTKPMRLARRVAMPDRLIEAKDDRIRSAAALLVEQLEPEDASGNRPLTSAESGLQQSGLKVYGVYCAQCHQATGRGQPDTGPSLVGSKWVLGEPATLAKLVLHGKQTPGNPLVMPPWGNVLDDRHIASILTYVRREWGHTVSPVSVEMVRKARAASASVNGLWTEEALLQHAGQSSAGSSPRAARDP